MIRENGYSIVKKMYIILIFMLVNVRIILALEKGNQD